MKGKGGASGHPKGNGAALQPYERCGAKLRGRRQSCRQVAGARTPHPGQGRCWLHGGLTPIRHGRYSKIKAARIGDLIEEHRADPDPLDVLPELAAARALLQDFIERYEVHTAALLAWHESYKATARPVSAQSAETFRAVLDEYEAMATESAGELTEKQADDLKAAREFVGWLVQAADDGKPRQILDLSDAVGHAEAITRMVKRVDDVRAGNAISRADLLRVMTEMGRVVEAHVRDQPTQEKIRDGWVAIRV